MAQLKYSRIYDRFSQNDAPSVIWNAHRYLHQMKQWLPQAVDARVLEIGPGNGLTMKLLEDMGYSVEAIEADEDLAARLTEKGLNVCFVSAQDTIAELSIRRGRYDFIYAHHVIEHVPVAQQIAFSSAIFEALKPGGLFLCETPNALAPLASWYRYADWTHTSIFTPPSLEFVICASGFEMLYLGKTIGGRNPSGGQPIKAAIEFAVSGMLLALSRLIQRVHLVAEWRIYGLTAPITAALLGVFRKPFEAA